MDPGAQDRAHGAWLRAAGAPVRAQHRAQCAQRLTEHIACAPGAQDRAHRASEPSRCAPSGPGPCTSLSMGCSSARTAPYAVHSSSPSTLHAPPWPGTVHTVHPNSPSIPVCAPPGPKTLQTTLQLASIPIKFRTNEYRINPPS